MAKTKVEPATTHKEDPLLTFKEVAVQVGRSESTIANWVHQKGRRRLKSVRMPGSGRRMVRQSTVNQILLATDDDDDPIEEYQEE